MLLERIDKKGGNYGKRRNRLKYYKYKLFRSEMRI